MSFQQLEQQDYNLLIIDDEIEITKSISRQFRKKYNVFSATSAKEGMAIMEKEHIQVILSDQRMPEMTGVDFFSIIKDKYPDALKLLLTGYSDIEAVIGAINEGQVFRYVTKPWNPEELESIVKEAFEKYELITNNRRLMLTLQHSNVRLEEKVKIRTSELEMLNSRLSDLNKEKNSYIGMVAHDLRNPIGMAEAFSGMLLEDFDTLTKSSQLEYIELINKRCSFSLNLIHEFLDISKIEAGIFDLNLSRQDYLAFLTDNVKRNAMLARNKSQKIVIETSISEINLCFDKNKIEQVLNNLLGNAIKYSLPNTQIQIEVSSSENWVTTRIIDEGQGIPQDELEAVFHPYKTTSVKATANEKSTGLGLAIVKKIIESHHGVVAVESEVGKGSVFSFKIPNL
jgi:signal transduction histidine kinase